MERNWTVRPLVEKDEEGIIELLRSVGFSTANQEMWKWKFNDNPLGFIGTVGVSDDHVVGHMSLMLVEMKIGQKIIRGAQAASLAVHQNFRRQGMSIEIGKALIKQAADNSVPVVYALPKRLASFRGFLKYGWSLVDTIPVLTKFLTRKALARLLLQSLSWFGRIRRQPFRFIKAWLDLLSYLLSRSKWRLVTPNYEAKIRDLTLFDSGVDELWKRISGEYEVAIVRSSEYMNWRYFGHASSPYKAFACRLNNRLEGYIVMSMPSPENQNKTAHIVDLLASSSEVMESLIVFAVDYCREQDISRVCCWMLQHHPAYGIITKYGFNCDKTEETAKLMVKVNLQDPDFSKLLESKNWLFMMGDSDYGLEVHASGQTQGSKTL
jgi:N-acetylglutamate synthase-like GNAT family acetyltransferase